MEDEGFLWPGCLGELGHPLREGVAGVVVGPRDMAVVAPLLVPDVDDGDAGVAGHGHQLRRRHVRNPPPSHTPAGPAAGADVMSNSNALGLPQGGTVERAGQDSPSPRGLGWAEFGSRLCWASHVLGHG